MVFFGFQCSDVDEAPSSWSRERPWSAQEEGRCSASQISYDSEQNY